MQYVNEIIREISGLSLKSNKLSRELECKESIRCRTDRPLFFCKQELMRKACMPEPNAAEDHISYRVCVMLKS